MDPVVVSAGGALVSAMAADGWERARDAVIGLWRSRRPAEAPDVAERLTALRSGVLAARAAGDELREAELTDLWRLRLAQLVADDPRALAALDALRASRWDAGGPPAPQPAVRLEGTASGDHSVLFQAGGNISVNGQ